MRSLLFSLHIAVYAVSLSSSYGQPEVDAPETLRWVKKQGQQIEASLHDAVHSNDRAYVLLQMHRAWREFDAVAQAGLYCHAARAAAERGRAACDLLSLDRKKDLSNLIWRATEAREEAFRMQAAAESCAADTAGLVEARKRFLPSDLLVRDALLAELDLSDAKASGDFHILAQKVEHALRMLRDAEYLASTLDNCATVQEACLKAMEMCYTALTVNQWEAAVASLRNALAHVQHIRAAASNCE